MKSSVEKHEPGPSQAFERDARNRGTFLKLTFELQSRGTTPKVIKPVCHLNRGYSTFRIAVERCRRRERRQLASLVTSRWCVPASEPGAHALRGDTASCPAILLDASRGSKGGKGPLSSGGALRLDHAMARRRGPGWCSVSLLFWGCAVSAGFGSRSVGREAGGALRTGQARSDGTAGLLPWEPQGRAQRDGVERACQLELGPCAPAPGSHA